jgi:hypothetical protein
MPKLRALLYVARGMAAARRINTREQRLDSLGFLPGKPHKMPVRSGFLDTDFNMHMNNAAYLSHAEFARYVRAACVRAAFTKEPGDERSLEQRARHWHRKRAKETHKMAVTRLTAGGCVLRPAFASSL